jgi:hypothetical protein
MIVPILCFLTNLLFLRNKMTYKLPKPNTDFLKKSISFQAVSLWNGLSLELKISRTFKEFKKSVKALKL